MALPAKMKNSEGEEVFVRIMDDLATTERSRWELWAEIHHGRVPLECFETWLKEECLFIKNNVDTDKNEYRSDGQEMLQNGIR